MTLEQLDREIQEAKLTNPESLYKEVKFYDMNENYHGEVEETLIRNNGEYKGHFIICIT